MSEEVKNARTQEERNAIAKARLCKAALELFALQGYASTTLSDVGLRAGYSRSLAQYHFPSKTKLAEVLLEDMGGRDMQGYVIRLPNGADGADAWNQLEQHFEQSWSNFRGMLGDPGDHQLAARGEMILCATAVFSPDPVLREKLKLVTGRFIYTVTEALELCIRDGIVRPDIDAASVAIFYTSSIWGLVNALFAEPDNEPMISGSAKVLHHFMQTLRA